MCKGSGKLVVYSMNWIERNKQQHGNAIGELSYVEGLRYVQAFYEQ